MSVKVPLAEPFLDEGEVRAVAEVIRSKWLLQGPKVRLFEERLGEFFGVHAVCVSSCTAALHLSMLWLGLRGREVFVPDFTFPATANAVIHAGGIPIFVDVDEGTFNIDPERLEEAVKRHPNAAAIIPVHLFGQPCDLKAVLEIAERYGLVVVQDAAGALGAEYEGRRVGSFGGHAAFSFDTRKPLVCGEGGAVVTPYEELADYVRSARSHGSSLETWQVHQAPTLANLSFPISGLNYRMGEMEAAIGLVQLRKLDFILSRRRALAELYDGGLLKIARVQTPYVAPETTRHTYQSYIVKLEGMNNVKFVEELRKRGVQVSYASRALHLEPCFKRFLQAQSGEEWPVSERLAAYTACLPLYPSMEEGAVQFVVEQIKEVVG